MSGAVRAPRRGFPGRQGCCKARQWGRIGAGPGRRSFANAGMRGLPVTRSTSPGWRRACSRAKPTSAIPRAVGGSGFGMQILGSERGIIGRGHHNRRDAIVADFVVASHPDRLPNANTNAPERGVVFWRREWDSNPRYVYTYTHFPGVRLRPLGHLSVGRILAEARPFIARSAERCSGLPPGGSRLAGAPPISSLP